MTEKMLADSIYRLGVHFIAGVPDSTLKLFCDYLQTDRQFRHQVCANEGAAVGMAVGSYLATGAPACVYMQNSGLGNIVNPYTSLVQREIYGIPMLFMIGWRGDDTGHDEPQHKFMGRATLPILDVLEIPYEVLNQSTTEAELENKLSRAAAALARELPFALVIQRGTFAEHPSQSRQNSYSLIRENVIAALLEITIPGDVIVSTTGKISREVYENLAAKPERKGQAFLTVGGMGFASSIALGIACESPDKRVLCLDGDGAILMQMGVLPTIGALKPKNFLHVCLNNQAHESVGGMQTGAPEAGYSEIAKSCGYTKALLCDDMDAFLNEVEDFTPTAGPVFLEVGVAISSRGDLGRPKESAAENKRRFRSYHWPD